MGKRISEFAMAAELIAQSSAAELRGDFGVLAGLIKIAFADIDLAERHVSFGEQRLHLQRDQEFALRVLRALLHAIQLCEVIVSLGPLRMLLKRSFLFADVTRRLAVENVVHHVAEEWLGLVGHRPIEAHFGPRPKFPIVVAPI